MHKDLIPFYYKSELNKPRAAILIHKSLEKSCWELPEFTTADQITLKIRFNSKDFIITSTYMDITKIIPSPNFSTVVKYAEKQNLPLIVGSDTNARHKLWGNKDRNTRGEELLDFLSSCGLSWANKGSTPTFINSRGHNSIIDLTLTNNKGGDEIGGWHVRDIY